MTALCTFIIDFVIDEIHSFRFFVEGRLSAAAAAVPWIIIMVSLVLFAVETTRKISSEAVGSGIPEMKTVLRNHGGVQSSYLSARTLTSKIIGIILAGGAGIPIGKEGPSVHIASAIAHQLGTRFKLFAHIIRSEQRAIEILASACAVGVASNFGAPIGGVLFSIEVKCDQCSLLFASNLVSVLEHGFSCRLTLWLGHGKRILCRSKLLERIFFRRCWCFHFQTSLGTGKSRRDHFPVYDKIWYKSF